MFLNLLQGGQRQMSRSEDLEAVQGISAMGEVQEGQVIPDISILLWNRKSRACSSESVMVRISLCSETIL